MSKPIVTFERTRKDEYRGLARSGRCYWIKRLFSGPLGWRLHACENADADLGDRVYTGSLDGCRAEANLIEHERISYDIDPGTSRARAIADQVWDAGRRFGGGS